jgi:hypothetical protein
LAESIFDKQTEQGKYFYCENGKYFRSIKELEIALLNCSSDECMNLFNRHTSGYKNDFAAWIGDVFGLKDLAQRIFSIKNPQELSKELARYEDEINEKIAKNADGAKNEINSTRNNQSEINHESKSEIKNEKKEIKNTSEQKNEIRKEIQNNEVSKMESATEQQTFEKLEPRKLDAAMEQVKDDVSKLSDKSDAQFDRVKKLKKHSFYNKADFAESVEDIRNRFDEINHSISEHRKEGKDMSIPAMMLRNIFPKINYFQVSQNRADYDKIIELMEDVEREINYSKELKHKDLKEEIMEALGLANTKKEEQ